MFTIEINPGVLAGMIAFTSNPFACERGFLASNLHVKRADLAGTVIAHNALASESHGSDPRSPLSSPVSCRFCRRFISSTVHNIEPTLTRQRWFELFYLDLKPLGINILR